MTEPKTPLSRSRCMHCDEEEDCWRCKERHRLKVELEQANKSIDEQADDIARYMESGLELLRRNKELERRLGYTDVPVEEQERDGLEILKVSELQVGDVIRHLHDVNAMTVVELRGEIAMALRTYTVSNPPEWRLMFRPEYQRPVSIRKD